MTKFHSDDYIKFLRSIRPDNMSEYNKQMQRCKLLNIRVIIKHNLAKVRISFVLTIQAKHSLGS